MSIETTVHDFLRNVHHDLAFKFHIWNIYNTSYLKVVDALIDGKINLATSSDLHKIGAGAA